MQERCSPAHDAQGNQIFQWSGETCWIARTRAVSALGDLRMLPMLQSKTIGENRTRFEKIVVEMLSVTTPPDELSLLQHI